MIKADKELTYYTKKLLEIVRAAIAYDDYKEYQAVAEKIDEAVQSEDFVRIHTQYPFLTDMFFHIIVAGLKSQEKWLDWLWENKRPSMPVSAGNSSEEQAVSEKLAYNSLPEIISESIRNNSLTASCDEKTIAEQIEDAFKKNLDDMDAFKKNLDDMKEYMSKDVDQDDIDAHIVMAKFQLKFIASDKRKEYLTQYISRLKELMQLPALQEMPKLLNRMRFFVEKYENIPVNVANEDEYEFLASNCGGDVVQDKAFFHRLTELLNEAHEKHAAQSKYISDNLEKLTQNDSADWKSFLRRWKAINTGNNIISKMDSPDASFAEKIKQGVDAQVLLHQMCARRYYTINYYGSGEIPAKHLEERFDRTGQAIEFNFETDGMAVDVSSYIIAQRMRGYLDGEHSDTYLISLIDNVCSHKMDHQTGARCKFKAAEQNESVYTPIENSQSDDNTTVLLDLIPALNENLFGNESGIFILKKIKENFFLLYLYLLLWRYGVSPFTLQELGGLQAQYKQQIQSIQGQLAQAGEKEQAKLQKELAGLQEADDFINTLTPGQKLNNSEKLLIIGKKGNGHFLGRELEKVLQHPEFNNPDCQDLLKGIKEILA